MPRAPLVGDALAREIREALRDVPDFPKRGILFKDITPLLARPALFRAATDAMALPFLASGITHVVAVESRGFIFGAPVAQTLGAAFVPVRKVGKLPWKTSRVDYALEYGSDALEMHTDALAANARVLVVDDVLASGGTAAAACRLIDEAGGEVSACVFLLELAFLNGAEKLRGREVRALLRLEV